MKQEDSFSKIAIRSKNDITVIGGFTFKRVEELLSSKGVKSGSAEENEVIRKVYEICRAYQELFGRKVSGTSVEGELYSSTIEELDELHRDLKEELAKL